jgi:Tfp pilus assembly protein PilN
MKAVNLLPSDQRGSVKTQVVASAPEKPAAAPQGSAFGAYVVLGLLAFAVAATAVYVLATNTVTDRKAELARVQREAADTTARAKALQGFADFQALADQRITTVRGLAESRFDWEQSLRDLSRALPSDVHLKTLKGSTSGATGGARGAIQAPALELSGCTTSQASVARLMSRLRNVRGVTRVSLTKSDKDGGGAIAAAPSTDGGVAASLCPKGQPPAFEMVVFFERAAVSASALPAGGAPATGQPTQAGSSTAAPAANGAAAATQPPADPAAPATASDQQPQTGTTTGVAAP